ncbi:2-amino-4-hydroxy-6-hydroxymethyldihydropteridine diphosphokinase [Psychrobacter sp. PL15]|nr:2-amino-4-hydroxy-6-hydroxymethyldihydropteridine diphosphokinase [Psychrobacter sp. PL15]
MTHKMRQALPLGLDVTKLKKCAPEPLQSQFVTALVLALGSNHHAEHYLARVREDLAVLGETNYSIAFQNPDFTATLEQPKPDYTNQCVYLALTSPTSLQQLQQIFKQFEGDCGRLRPLSRLTHTKNKYLPEAESGPIRQVTMDIDILLVKLSGQSDQDNNEWIIMADRYPFKAHENTGIVELTI